MITYIPLQQKMNNIVFIIIHSKEPELSCQIVANYVILFIECPREPLLAIALS